MVKKLSITFLITVVFATIGLLGYAQIWAKPPCEQVRIFDNRIKVVFEPECEEVKEVYFWRGTPGDGTNSECDDGGCSPTNCSACPEGNCDSCWRLATEETAVMCTCEGSECVDDLQTNIDNSNVTVVCYLVTDTGPLSGCPIYLNPDRYFFGGGYYGR
ncbi:MAG: hypothetical protein IMF11_19590 [Proteobacteria bacterium]|nr:hypothetical protein [Pseudomonadota bacterium]